MSDHAPLAPSSAPIWGFCSGSVPAQLGEPDISTPEAEEGTAAHWVLEQCLLGWKAGGTPAAFDWVGSVAPNGVVVDEHIAECVQVGVDDVIEVCQQYGTTDEMLIEFRVHMPTVHEHNWGTSDVGIYFPRMRHLFVWDYKHGHRENRAKENLQLIDYAEGYRLHFGIDGYYDQQTKLSLRVVQPNCYHADGAVNKWDILLSDIRPYINQLRGKAWEAFNAPVLSPGKHCRDCRAVLPCPAARRAVHSWADYANSPYELDTMTGPDLAVELRIIEDGMAVAKARAGAITDELTHRIQNGEADTGKTLGTGRPGWKFSCPPAQAVAFARNFGVDIAKEATLTPTQAVAKCPRDMRDNFKLAINSITTRQAGSLKLIDAEDSLAVKAFKRK